MSAANEVCYADVAVMVPHQLDDTLFTYRVPEAMVSFAAPGARVKIPFGRGDLRDGFLVLLHQTPPEDVEIKEIAQLLDFTPLLLPDQVELGLWLARHSVTTPYYALQAMMPGMMRLKKTYRLRPRNGGVCDETSLDEKASKLYHALLSEGALDCDTPDAMPGWSELLATGCVTVEEHYCREGKGAEIQVYRALADDRAAFDELSQGALKAAPKQRKLLFDLMENGPQTSSQLEKRHGQSYQALKSLCQKGYVQKRAEQIMSLPFYPDTFSQSPAKDLNGAQCDAVDQITSQFTRADKMPLLLHGVTGSGKTEVYIQVIQETLLRGRSALLLVPEIALTAQLLGRLRGALSEPVGVWHSRMNESERLTIWNQLLNKEVRVLVGVRSAVFAPLPNLGMVIIDEEHEHTYKQSEPEPRYHARAVAYQRVKQLDAVLVLGSATPSLETMQGVYNHEIRYLSLPDRVAGRPLPEMEIIDRRGEITGSSDRLFSPSLLQALRKTLQRGEQVILFLNRRGYASFLMCPECGEAVKCARCDITMTYHHTRQLLRCHYCDAVAPVPDLCPACGTGNLEQFGVGTEQVEAALQAHFPEVTFARLDYDTTRKKNAYHAILENFSKGATQVLIGTQMIAKGFDFPGVTLVGLISADMSLHLADYKAAEHTFQLILQVAGRAGRGDKPGRVLIQTYHPDHYAITCAANYDTAGFYTRELALRGQLEYPPTNHLLRIVVSHRNKEEVRYTAGAIKAFLFHYGEEGCITTLGPSAAPVERIRGRYRAHFILKSPHRITLEKLGHALLRAYGTLRKNETLRILVDIDPENIL